MKKFNFTKLIIFVMTIALLIGTALCVTAMADEADTKGEFGGISVSYGDRVYIRVQVNATEEEIANGDVIVSYTLNGETKNATFYEKVDENTVWTFPGDNVLVAEYLKADEHSIIYILDGGKDPSNPNKYTEYSQSFTLNNPTKENSTGFFSASLSSFGVVLP